jgi:prenylcysteine oxidase / farnesylcysteine lyase
VNAHSDPSLPVELGASIFVSVNQNLVNAAKDLGLIVSSVSVERPKEAGDALGVFDGEKMVFLQPYSEGKVGNWWSLARLLYKYGPLAPIRTQRLMQTMVGRFLRMYEAPVFPFKSLTEAAEQVGLLQATGVTGEQFLDANGITGKFTTDLIQASTRVNYGQNLGLIHGLETMVCMAAEGAMSVEGGNWQIFKGMVDKSRAVLQLNTTVTGLKSLTKNGKKVWTISSKNSAGVAESAEFDEVVLAAPYQFANLKIEPPLEKTPDEIPYVTLHVTLLTTKKMLDPAYFKLPLDSMVPEAVLTTLNKTEQEDSKERYTRGEGKHAAGSVGFFSVSTLRKITTEKHGDEYLYKVFSPLEFSDSQLDELFGGAAEVSWIYRHIVCSFFPFDYS